MACANERFLVFPSQCSGKSNSDKQSRSETRASSDGNQVNFIHSFSYPVRSSLAKVLRTRAFGTSKTSYGMKGKLKNMAYVFNMFSGGKIWHYSAIFCVKFYLR